MIREGYAVKDHRILVVDDNALFRTGVERALHSQGYTHVRTASDGWQALESVQKEPPDVVLLDLYLPGMDGLHVLTEIHKIDKNIPILMLTCESDGECIHAAESLGALDYLVKPLEMSILFSSLETRLKDRPTPHAV
jgi:DNA-binding response OmpR family regulator